MVSMYDVRGFYDPTDVCDIFRAFLGIPNSYFGDFIFWLCVVAIVIWLRLFLTAFFKVTSIFVNLCLYMFLAGFEKGRRNYRRPHENPKNSTLQNPKTI